VIVSGIQIMTAACLATVMRPRELMLMPTDLSSEIRSLIDAAEPVSTEEVFERGREAHNRHADRRLETQYARANTHRPLPVAASAVQACRLRGVVPRRHLCLCSPGPGLTIHLAQAEGDEIAGQGIFYIHRQDADRVAEEWRQAGIEVDGLRDENYGKREGSITDPDGNVIRFGSPIRRGTGL
jgi:hypothetical protein